MAATRKMDLEQMKSVLQEMNTHPEARLFYGLQERGAGLPESSGTLRLTLPIVTEKVSKALYPNLTAFVEDMTMIFSSCSNTPLASGAASLRVLFTELLAKHTSVLDAYDFTPPGNKKRGLRRSLITIPFLDEEDDVDPFLLDSDEEFAEFCLADESLGDELLQSEDRAALIELTEEIASIEAEIQQLRETKTDLNDSSTQPGFGSHLSVLDALKTPGLYASSVEEGRMALSESRKRPRRNSTVQVKADEDWTQYKKRRANSKSDSKQLQEFQAEIMTKEQLLNTITNDLPPAFLEGVIRIVNPTYDPSTATEEDLEFDINLLDDDVLARLQQYVNTILKAPQRKMNNNNNTNTRPKRQPVKNAHKKETPRKRLQKEAPKKVNRRKSSATGSRKRSTPTKQQQKKQQSILAATLKRSTFVSAEIMQQIFMKEEIVRAKKSDEDEDEEVDILD